MDRLRERLLLSFQKLNEDKSTINEFTNSLKSILLSYSFGHEFCRELVRLLRTELESPEIDDGTSFVGHIFTFFVGVMSHMLDEKWCEFDPVNQAPTIVLFVGEGGDNICCQQYGNFYLNKGLKPCIIHALPVFDEEPISISNLPSFSSKHFNPLRGVLEGIQKFSADDEDRNLIIIEAFGLIDRTVLDQIYNSISPHCVINVINGELGRYAHLSRVRASFDIDAYIVSQAHLHDNSIGVLSVISPVIFLSFGDNIDSFMEYNGQHYVTYLLDMKPLSETYIKKLENISDLEESIGQLDEADVEINGKLYEDRDHIIVDLRRSEIHFASCSRHLKLIKRFSISSTVTFTPGAQEIKNMSLFAIEKVLEIMPWIC